MDIECPKCLTTKYRNPSMKLLVNVCGHGLCESCVETLFAKGSGSCPECSIPLRRGNFRLQLFEDASIDKEVDIRRRILRDFCKTREEFDNLRSYNDYLEMVEDIIYNLSNGIDVEQTQANVRAYKEANKEHISRNKHRVADDRLELDDIVAEEKRAEAKRKADDAKIEAEAKKAKARNKEKLIDDLMFSDSDAKSILEEHKTAAKFSTAAELAAATRNQSAASVARKLPQHLVQAKPYVYEEFVYDFEGPDPPADEYAVISQGFGKQIRPAQVFEKAAGYVESTGALRALQEAMSGLFFESN